MLWLRRFHWWLRGLVRRRTVDLFLAERVPELPQPDGVEIRIGGPADENIAARLALLRDDDPEDYRSRLRAGHILVYVIGADDSLQAWVWATAPTEAPQEFPWEFGIRMRVRPGSGFLWDAYTVPAYRGRSLYTAVLRHSGEQCFLRGATQVWGYVEVHHTVSRRGVVSARLVAKNQVELRKFGPFCHVSRPGFSQIVASGGILELNALVL